MKNRKIRLSLMLFISASIALTPSGKVALAGDPARAGQDVIDLAGRWDFRLDPRNIGEAEKWHDRDLPCRIKLPGSAAENGFGDEITVDTKWTGDIVDRSWYTEKKIEKYRQPGNIKLPFWLTPVKHYVGTTWYRRTIDIPQRWQGKRIILFLERPHWETKVWVDSLEIGMQNSLSTPHEYDLGALNPGRHRLTIRVDNTVKIDVGVNSHSISDHTQTNWNGIIGKIELRSTDPVWIDDLQVYPDVPDRKVKVRLVIANTTGGPVQGVLDLNARTSSASRQHRVTKRNIQFTASGPQTVFETEYLMGNGVLLWDEFSPNVYRMTATIQTPKGRDSRSVDFGMREFAAQGMQFTINGRKTFLRGTLECCIFPLTGYPPMDVDGWARIIGVAKTHGLNHFRFHSWCPPEAAFSAADRLGFYFQVECASWANQGATIGDGNSLDRYIYDEGDRILKTYGNHPSFCLLTYGNEPAGQHQERYLGELVNHWKSKDPRRLYAGAAGWPVIPENQYQSTSEPRGHQWLAGLGSRMNANPPETRTDYRGIIAKYTVPVVSHEIGQWCAYPNFKEIKKYTGVTRAYNFEIFRELLNESRMLDQAHDFLMASGKLQTLCYKEEIETALRTPGFGGFQLLDLHDFPGQGTALVGVLDAFWDSKGYVTPKEYHRFACETVPLARMAKRIWTSNETFRADIEISHFGAAPISRAVPVWTISDVQGRAVASGRLSSKTIPLGNGTELGEVSLPLSDITSAKKLVLTVAIQNTGYSNDWDFWVYPERAEQPVSQAVLITDDLNEHALDVLKKGGKVMLCPGPDRIKGDAYGKVPPGFTSIFWNTAWTGRQAPHTLGILCDPKNPALADFPTEYHCNWQWWELVTKSQIMILNDFPAGFRPIVQVIDDWNTNRKLGLVFECRIGRGKFLMCSIDLRDLQKRPVARQMRFSLIKYMQSDEFNPTPSLDAEHIKNLFIKL
jgi:hypothetical protein